MLVTIVLFDVVRCFPKRIKMLDIGRNWVTSHDLSISCVNARLETVTVRMLDCISSS